MTNRKSLWKRVWVWYKGLPWWGKVLAAVPILVLLALLVLAAVVSYPVRPWKGSSDLAHANGVDAAVALANKRDERLAAIIAAKKSEVAGLVVRGLVNDDEAATAVAAIDEARSIAEVDAIVRGLR